MNIRCDNCDVLSWKRRLHCVVHYRSCMIQMQVTVSLMMLLSEMWYFRNGMIKYHRWIKEPVAHKMSPNMSWCLQWCHVPSKFQHCTGRWDANTYSAKYELFNYWHHHNIKPFARTFIVDRAIGVCWGADLAIRLQMAPPLTVAIPSECTIFNTAPYKIYLFFFQIDHSLTRSMNPSKNIALNIVALRISTTLSGVLFPCKI